MTSTKMAENWAETRPPEHTDDPFRKLTALVVDDSPSQRKMLTLLLKKWAFEVIEAGDGTEALEICRERRVDFIISDWMMPEMSGPELCQEVRALGQENYVYFILVTSKRGKDEVAEGLDAGADDFLTKPLDMGEMHARLRAGQRLVMMQEDLVDKNKRITEAFDRLNAIYESIDKDLRAAARLQKSLIPQRQSKCGSVSIGVAYKPAGHVGGDLLGYFQVAEDRIAAYSIDVSGHGVSSALLTARLSNLFSSQHLHENIALRHIEDGMFLTRDPASIARELNERMQDDTDTDQYFTMVFADLNLSTGMMRFCQAGHPNPVVIRATGEIEFVGEGGAPIGLIPDMEYETYVIHLADGDRFMAFSDGITECEDPNGEMLENEGLSKLLSRHWDMRESEVLENILGDMAEFTGNSNFDDDVSALMLTYPVTTI